jgi:hypothetical protein
MAEDSFINPDQQDCSPTSPHLLAASQISPPRLRWNLEWLLLKERVAPLFILGF